MICLQNELQLTPLMRWCFFLHKLSLGWPCDFFWFNGSFKKKEESVSGRDLKSTCVLPCSSLNLEPTLCRSPEIRDQGKLIPLYKAAWKAEIKENSDKLPIWSQLSKPNESPCQPLRSTGEAIPGHQPTRHRSDQTTWLSNTTVHLINVYCFKTPSFGVIC